MNPATFTYGFELEVGDVPRSIAIPPELGAWEQSERDIVNLREPYRHVAADPLGLNPPVGGEVNIFPARTPEELASRVMSVLSHFTSHGAHPSFCCTTHSHVHVRVPGLRDDIQALKRLMRYIQRWQRLTIQSCGRFEKTPDMGSATTYMRYDGGREMPDWMIENILTHAHDFDSFILLHMKGKDPAGRSGRPLRYAINTYCLKHIDTIEFRMFRSTGCHNELLACIKFAQLFMTNALSPSGVGVDEILRNLELRGLKFPPMRFDPEEWRGLQATKHPETRGKKVRTLHEL